MFKRVLVGVDQETRGRDAIALAGRLTSEDGALLLAHVHPGFPLSVKRPVATVDTVEDDDSQLFLRTVIADTGLHAEIRSISGGSVGPSLHRVAERENADLLVVGSSRRGLLGRVLLGDRTLEALNGASCAVAVAPAGYADQGRPIGAIGVAFDGTDESLDALAVARGLADLWHARLSVCTVVSPQAYGAVVATRESVDYARRRLAEFGDEVDAWASVGDPAEELAVYSGSVDLLVVGSRSYGPLGRLVHGRTERRLLRVARSPLLVVPRGTRVVLDSTHKAAELTYV